MSRSSVQFTNSSGGVISIAYMRRDWNCQNECGEPWDVLGWVVLNPGETQSRDNPTNNKYFYIYVEAEDGTVWNGDYVAEVAETRFEKCICLGVTGTTYFDVGFLELDLDFSNSVNVT